jgi:hypothetical protein
MRSIKNEREEPEMTRQVRLWILRGGGLIGGVLILTGTLKHVSWVAYLGGLVVIALFFVSRQWLKDEE